MEHLISLLVYIISYLMLIILYFQHDNKYAYLYIQLNIPYLFQIHVLMVNMISIYFKLNLSFLDLMVLVELILELLLDYHLDHNFLQQQILFLNIISLFFLYSFFPYYNLFFHYQQIYMEQIIYLNKLLQISN